MFLFSTGVKIGIIVGLILFFLVLALLIFIYLYDGRHKRHL